MSRARVVKNRIRVQHERMGVGEHGHAQYRTTYKRLATIRPAGHRWRGLFERSEVKRLLQDIAVGALVASVPLCVVVVVALLLVYVAAVTVVTVPLALFAAPVGYLNNREHRRIDEMELPIRDRNALVTANRWSDWEERITALFLRIYSPIFYLAKKVR